MTRIERREWHSEKSHYPVYSLKIDPNYKEYKFCDHVHDDDAKGGAWFSFFEAFFNRRLIFLVIRMQILRDYTIIGRDYRRRFEMARRKMRLVALLPNEQRRAMVAALLHQNRQHPRLLLMFLRPGPLHRSIIAQPSVAVDTCHFQRL